MLMSFVLLIGSAVAHEFWYERDGDGIHFCTCTASIPSICHCTDAPISLENYELCPDTEVCTTDDDVEVIQ